MIILLQIAAFRCIIELMKGDFEMATISLIFDDQMKKELDEMCDALGMNLTTFFMIYAKKALSERRIPFDLSLPANGKSSNGTDPKEDGLQAFYEIRRQLADVPEMSLDEINAEIAEVRTERRARL